jgi:hypothetical protein
MRASRLTEQVQGPAQAVTSPSQVLIVDPILDFLGPATNSDKATDVRRVLSPLRELAEKHNVAIVAMNHLNKSGKGPKTRSLGSGAFVQVARVELRVCEDPSDDDRRLLLVVKNNLAKAPGLSYRIELWEANPEIGSSRRASSRCDRLR